mmetsp:Transcript_2273/g.4539  ORF Transcript_2273/g.4539 Transcript_2273/m.4539 type:complete len:370 (+) Transcript_2273:100-1209(+)
MGKKGKKKQKITGTPDVVKFKGTREFWLLKECVVIQESLPFVEVDALDELAYKKVARFLNMVGLLAEHLQVESKKDYRFNYHHKYLAPTPQFFPFGFDVNVIRAARSVQERPSESFNGKDYEFKAYHSPSEFRSLSAKFLKDVDQHMTKIASCIEPALKDDFATGLKRWKSEMQEDLVVFDEIWSKYETELVKSRHAILTQVYEPVDRLINIELQMSQAEERLDIESKQRLENDFVHSIEDFTHTLFPESATDMFPEDVIPLAEACIFYESKCTEEWLLLCKYLLKDYLELRIYIAKIPEERINPHLKQNTDFMRLLKSFHNSVIAAREALAFVAQLPKLIHAKISDWMTKDVMEPDLKYIQATAQFAM